MRRFAITALFIGLALGGCRYAPTDERGVAAGETLLSVSATGEADMTPDEAQFEAGMESFGSTAREASTANDEAVAGVVAALRALGVPERDLQTRTVGIQRIQYGDREGQYRASNIVSVTLRDVTRAGDAVTAVTEAGANVLSGPDLRLSNPEAAANMAYTAAYRSARLRAQAYADAADMEIARVLYIRDGGGQQGNRYLPGAQAIDIADAVAPPPPQSTVARPEQAQAYDPVMPGRTTSAVSVQVDFALTPK
ncbi:MAG: SIMPL domain-containing protein [Pontixanthobacter sp.]